MSIKSIIGGDEFRWRHVAFLYVLMVLFGAILESLPKDTVFNVIAFIHMMLALIAALIGAVFLFVEKKGGKW